MSMPLTLPQLFDRFSDDAAAERCLVRQHWPDGVCCPNCDTEDVQARPTRKPQPYRCRVCRRDFSVKTATVMHGSRKASQNASVVRAGATPHSTSMWPTSKMRAETRSRPNTKSTPKSGFRGWLAVCRQH